MGRPKSENHHFIVNVRRIHFFGIILDHPSRSRVIDSITFSIHFPLLEVVRQGMITTLVGLAIGSLAALVLTRIIRTLLFAVEPTDPLTFLTIFRSAWRNSVAVLYGTCSSRHES